MHTESDWELEDDGKSRTYTGFFKVKRTTFRIDKLRGKIVEWRGLPTDVFIEDPPPEIRLHPHGSCFQLWEPGTDWFKLHFVKPAGDFVTARLYVEGLLREAFDLAGRPPVGPFRRLFRWFLGEDTSS